MKNNEPSNIIRYQWDQDWADQIVHNIPIAKVAEELSELKEVYGKITPQILVDSSKNKKSVFHHYFEWDDEKAANALRLQRAAQILSHIEIKIIKDGKPVLLQAVEVKSVPSFTTKRKYTKPNYSAPAISEEYTTLVKRGVINDLRILVNKLTRLNAPQTVIVLLNTTIEELSKESTETTEIKPGLSAVV